MRKLIVSEFVSLDGVMQAPGGIDEDRDGGFARGGWTMPFWHDDIGKTFFALMQGADAFLLGRGGRRLIVRGLPTNCWSVSIGTYTVCMYCARIAGL